MSRYHAVKKTLLGNVHRCQVLTSGLSKSNCSSMGLFEDDIRILFSLSAFLCNMSGSIKQRLKFDFRFSNLA